MTSPQRLDDLVVWLETQAVDTTGWGHDNTKSVLDLWAEYQAGDTTFEGDPPRRTVRVVQLLVQREGRTLLELAQILRDGQRRWRHQLPSEKLKRGETHKQGALRCAVEELAVLPDQVTLGDVVETEERTIPSPSYPGLPTHYTFYRVQATIDGLPDEDFWRDNKAAAGTDPVSRHKWGWRDWSPTGADD